MASESPTSFSGYVLAGGRSSRMGTDKALLPYRESNLLHHALETLSTALGNPCKVVVSSHKSEIYRKILPSEAIVADIFPDRGALGGIHAALSDCGSQYAFVLAVDLPLVTAASAVNLMRAVSKDTDAAVPEQDDGRLQPLCAAYRVEHCLPMLQRLFATQTDSSVRDLLARVRTTVLPRSTISEDPSIFRNINTREAYESLFDL